MWWHKNERNKSYVRLQHFYTYTEQARKKEREKEIVISIRVTKRGQSIVYQMRAENQSSFSFAFSQCIRVDCRCVCRDGE